LNFSDLVPVISVDEKQKLSYLKNKSVLVENFYSAELVKLLQSTLPTIEYYPHEYELGPESHVQELVAKPRFMNLVVDLMNDPSTILALEQITGLSGLHHFNGRHYRLDSTLSGIGWHQDIDSNKKLGVTINISPEVFAGGELVIRHRSTGELQKFHNTGIGDAVFFEIHEDYEHCVLPVTGDVPKLTVTGWYLIPGRDKSPDV
jgi:hypothetical protein